MSEFANTSHHNIYINFIYINFYLYEHILLKFEQYKVLSVCINTLQR